MLIPATERKTCGIKMEPDGVLYELAQRSRLRVTRFFCGTTELNNFFKYLRTKLAEVEAKGIYVFTDKIRKFPRVTEKP